MMAFLFGEDMSGTGDPAEFGSRLQSYREYLQSVKADFPPNAYEFAAAPWHYDTDDHRCPHDSWVESLVVKELSTGERHQHRTLEIHLQLLGAYHDGHLTVIYHEVQSYSLDTPPGYKMPPSHVGHGDWLVDEVRLSERGHVVHEVTFSRGSRWLIECKDITHHWLPF
jgi:hypothetical protein